PAVTLVVLATEIGQFPTAAGAAVVTAARIGLDIGLALLRLGAGGGALHQDFIGRLAIDALVILPGERAERDQPRTLGIGERAEARRWRPDQGALYDGRHALFLQRRNQRLTSAQRRNGGEGVEIRIGAEGLGRRLDRLLLAWRIGAQGMLDAVAEL